MLGGRWSHEFRIAVFLACGLICLGRLLSPVRPLPLDGSPKGQGLPSPRIQKTSPHTPLLTSDLSHPSQGFLNTSGERGGCKEVQTTAHSTFFPLQSKFWAPGFSPFPVLPTGLPQFAPSGGWKKLELSPYS